MAAYSEVISSYLEERVDDNTTFKVKDVHGEVLKIVVGYLRSITRIDRAYNGIEGYEWHRDMGIFEKNFTSIEYVDDNWLFGLVSAANYLEIDILLNLLTDAIAERLGGLSLEKLREKLLIEDDLTPEEHKIIEEENSKIIAQR